MSIKSPPPGNKPSHGPFDDEIPVPTPRYDKVIFGSVPPLAFFAIICFAVGILIYGIWQNGW